MDMSLRATLPFWGIGLFTMLVSLCFCCFLRRLRNQGRAEQNGYRTLLFSKLKTIDTETCAICIEEYQTREKVAVCNCKHIFHVKCLEQWLMNSNTCPMCKQSIRNNDSQLAPDLLQLVEPPAV